MNTSCTHSNKKPKKAKKPPHHGPPHLPFCKDLATKPQHEAPRARRARTEVPRGRAKGHELLGAVKRGRACGPWTGRSPWTKSRTRPVRDGEKLPAPAFPFFSRPHARTMPVASRSTRRRACGAIRTHGGFAAGVVRGLCGFVRGEWGREKFFEKSACLRWVGMLYYAHSFWGYSSVGRASEWHSEGQEFESPYLHHIKRIEEKAATSGLFCFQCPALKKGAAVRK